MICSHPMHVPDPTRNPIAQPTSSASHNTAPAGASVKTAPKPSKSAPKPPAHSPSSDVEMEDPPSDGLEPLPPPVGDHNRPLTPPTDPEDGVDQPVGPENDSDHDAEAKDGASEHDGDGNLVGYGQLTKRQRAQLRAFTPEAREIVLWVTEQIKLDMATICPFPERMTANPEDQRTYLDNALVKYWAKGNEELREGRVPLQIKDVHATYVSNSVFTLFSSAHACGL